MLPLYSAGFPNERMILSLTLEKSQSMAGPSVPLPPLAHSVTDEFNPYRQPKASTTGFYNLFFDLLPQIEFLYCWFEFAKRQNTRKVKTG